MPMFRLSRIRNSHFIGRVPYISQGVRGDVKLWPILACSDGVVLIVFGSFAAVGSDALGQYALGVSFFGRGCVRLRL